MTTQKITEITAFDKTQVANMKVVLDDMALNNLRVRYEGTLPTVDQIDENECVVYDNGAGDQALCFVTREGNLFCLTSSGIPSGGIIAWSGAISAIPSGYVICDGTNSTPDLTDRFILHADADSGGTNNVGDTGGSSSSSDHTHDVAASDGTGGVGQKVALHNNAANTATIAGAALASGGGAGTNRDKYFALAYIMKT